MNRAWGKVTCRDGGIQVFQANLKIRFSFILVFGLVRQVFEVREGPWSNTSLIVVVEVAISISEARTRSGSSARVTMVSMTDDQMAVVEGSHDVHKSDMRLLLGYH